MRCLHHCRDCAMIVCLLAGLLGALPAMAAGQSRDPEQILAALGSDSFRERQDQTLRLLADDTLDMDALADLLARARTPEQRHRLLGVARHHVLRLRREQVFDQPDRGSLGISHRTLSADQLPDLANHSGPVIEIVLTLPGFPAHGQLEPGDRIVGLEGEPLPANFTAEAFRERIINYRSGDELQVTIDRQGEQLTRTITLASVQALGAMYHPGELELRPQFETDWANARRTLLVGEQDVSTPLRLTTSQINTQ